jgi:hypothetical protein
MAKREISTFKTTRIFSIALITIFLCLGFCPLRNTLFAIIFHSKSIPKVTGARLLNAQDNCKTTVLEPSTATRQTVSWQPPLFPSILQLSPFITAILLSKTQNQSLNCIDPGSKKVPIYTLNRTLRI